MDKSVA
ncbi:hypothetical protein CCHL11_02778 [Colletotrichum chlorophyti]|nr:hypothetical protein CCHL11_02778 [Colletotrichum chlorophyti]